MRSTAYPLLLTTLLVCTIGCGDSRNLGVEDGAPQPDAGPLPVADTGPVTPDAHPSPPDFGPEGERCVVAIRTDNCCESAQPVKASAVALDPCLVLWPPKYPIDEACEAKWETNCNELDCMSAPPLSRVAALVNGQCQFTDECTTVEDCTIATDLRHCCSCDQAYPKALLEVDPCLLTPNMASAPESCLPDCSAVRCDECQMPARIECSPGDDLVFNRCETFWTN